MANAEHLDILLQGVEKWNEWRKANSYTEPDLEAADLSNKNLSEADFSWVNLDRANLFQARLGGAKLYQAKLRGADLTGANLISANLIGVDLNNALLTGASLLRANMEFAQLPYANLEKAKLMGANLSKASLFEAIMVGADLSEANLRNADLAGATLEYAILRSSILDHANLEGASLTGADLENAILDYAILNNANLTNANLTRANLVETSFTKTIITGCRIYGISAWNLTSEQSIQKDLVISRPDEPVITVDDLEVAQFIYLMLNNNKVRNVLNSITSKGVLILGRFSDPERKSVLDGLREKLRQFDLLPIVFDFDRPTDKDYTETVQTLAGMSMFVIADLTNPKSTPLELEATVKQFKIPYVPIIDISVDKRPFAMLVDLQKSFHWVLPTLQYETKESLLDDDNLKEYIFDRVNKKREELRQAKSDEPQPILIRKKNTEAPPA